MKLLTTMLDVCVRSSADMNLNSISPCPHEEADKRLFQHVESAASEGHRNILIISIDSDVVKLSVGVYIKLQHKLDELWIEFGTRQYRKYNIYNAQTITVVISFICMG